MLASDIPDKIELPFANTGSKNVIPVVSQIGITDGAASFTDGFPPLTMTPKAAGGIPPSGLDVNGILNAITAVQQWQSAGGHFKYDATFSTAIGGYPAGAILQSSDGMSQFLSLIDNNTDDPNSGTSVNWALVSSATIDKLQRFEANGSFTVPAGITTIYVSGCAGGGGGGGGGRRTNTAEFGGGGGGGGAGQNIWRQKFTVIPGDVISITIGGAGSGGTTVIGANGNGGTSGGNTVIGTLITLTGGGAGAGGGGAAGFAGGIGGTGYPQGSYGTDGSLGTGGAAQGSGNGGAGASCPFGGGGGAVRSTSSGSAGGNAGYVGAGYGSGGSGGSTGTSGTGGNGAPGLVIIEW